MKHLVIVALFLLLSCGDVRQLPSPTTVTTSAGIRVTSDSTLSLGHLSAIDNQYDDLLRIAAAPPNNYEVFPAPTAIQIFVVRRDFRCQQIAFVIVEDVPRGTNYDGSQYDLDGQANGRVEMCVAGRFHSGNGSIEVTADGIVQTDIVRYELEHKILKAVDPDRYVRTLIHTAENPHPILGNGNLSVYEYGPGKDLDGTAEMDGDSYVGLD